MENFTIHIFGYGETQINSKDLSIKVKTDTLVSVKPLVDAIFLKKPKTNASTIDTCHLVNIFGYNDIRWACNVRGVEGFDLKDDESFKVLIDNLIIELQSVKDALTV